MNLVGLHAWHIVPTVKLVGVHTQHIVYPRQFILAYKAHRLQSYNYRMDFEGEAAQTSLSYRETLSPKMQTQYIRHER